jgi:hypothetical protein
MGFLPKGAATGVFLWFTLLDVFNSSVMGVWQLVDPAQ